ncbi:MAG: M15 family metallopeptidase [Saprospiraceae bacterium]|nr:M15 family metallopeptidase [Saprospiraceae bacterium]MBK8448688.1 M15 family metallopeptidase [Saprospiraceae bacterium]MBK8482815.1 M15 family metallopeptidase [Saprospiraceae bacterium]MBK9722826.1 M15 family metallopeptidase [Saprospiraceae bacterium]MBK9726727.1 M15 family metallopeptidase [Saprospiraceae bacterium]
MITPANLLELAMNSVNTMNRNKVLDIEDPKYIAGRFDPAENPEFVSFNSDTSTYSMFLRTEVYIAFLKMAKAALKDSITLGIVSATRSFDYQKELWENKWTGKTPVDGKKLHLQVKDPVLRAKKILEYSAPPGFSRHHWGTDIDLNSTEPEYFETEEGKKVFEWLQKNAKQFGFCQTYTPLGQSRPTGFNEEKWHWSYISVAEKIWKAQLKGFEDQKNFRFKGYTALKSLNLLDYVRNVNHQH